MRSRVFPVISLGGPGAAWTVRIVADAIAVNVAQAH